MQTYGVKIHAQMSVITDNTKLFRIDTTRQQFRTWWELWAANDIEVANQNSSPVRHKNMVGSGSKVNNPFRRDTTRTRCNCDGKINGFKRIYQWHSFYTYMKRSHQSLLRDRRVLQHAINFMRHTPLLHLTNTPLLRAGRERCTAHARNKDLSRFVQDI